jgi:hypothetical protein
LEVFALKKLYALVLSALFILSAPAKTLAAPYAEPSMSALDAVDTGDALEFTLRIDIGEPSEPYSALDFNLVSSNFMSLSIASDSLGGDGSGLAIEFVQGYGSANHKGRIDETSGAISYLMGIFSPSGGNAISGDISVCSIRIRYEGQEPETLSIKDLRLIYVTADGFIDSVRIEPGVLFAVSPEAFVDIDGKGIPLTSEVDHPTATETSDKPVRYLWYIVGAICMIAAISAILAKRRKKSDTA